MDLLRSGGERRRIGKIDDSKPTGVTWTRRATESSTGKAGGRAHAARFGTPDPRCVLDSAQSGDTGHRLPKDDGARFPGPFRRVDSVRNDVRVVGGSCCCARCLPRASSCGPASGEGFHRILRGVGSGTPPGPGHPSSCGGAVGVVAVDEQIGWIPSRSRTCHGAGAFSRRVHPGAHHLSRRRC